MLTDSDIQCLWPTAKLALATTILLLIIGIPMAWWLSQTKSRWRNVINALISLPLVLPPTVLGFYLLLFLGPQGPIGSVTQQYFGFSLPFTFTGLLIGSFFYTLPFVIRPIQNAFESIGPRPLEIAATLGASPLDRFFTIALPLARPGIFTAAILGMTHTIGEFGVALMLGGNIPGKTRIISVAIYDYVETLNYQGAHRLSGILILFSFIALLLLNSQKRLTSWGV